MEDDIILTLYELIGLEELTKIFQRPDTAEAISKILYEDYSDDDMDWLYEPFVAFQAIHFMLSKLGKGINHKELCGLYKEFMTKPLTYNKEY